MRREPRTEPVVAAGVETTRTTVAQATEPNSLVTTPLLILTIVAVIIVGGLWLKYRNENAPAKVPVMSAVTSGQTIERVYPYVVKINVSKDKMSEALDVNSNEHIEVIAVEDDLAFKATINNDVEHPVAVEARTDTSFHHHDVGEDKINTIAFTVDPNSLRENGTIKCIYTKKKS